MATITAAFMPWYTLGLGDAELVIVQGASVAAIYRTNTEVQLGDALVQTPTLRVPATVVAAEGGAVTVRGASHVIRQVLDLPPDGTERLLLIARGLAPAVLNGLGYDGQAMQYDGLQIGYQ